MFTVEPDGEGTSLLIALDSDHVVAGKAIYRSGRIARQVASDWIHDPLKKSGQKARVITLKFEEGHFGSVRLSDYAVPPLAASGRRSSIPTVQHHEIYEPGAVQKYRQHFEDVEVGQEYYFPLL